MAQIILEADSSKLAMYNTALLAKENSNLHTAIKNNKQKKSFPKS
jgi:hypothetical protein